jgi:hypothetical protein
MHATRQRAGDGGCAGRARPSMQTNKQLTGALRRRLQSVFLLHEPEDRTTCARPPAARASDAPARRRAEVPHVGWLFVCLCRGRSVGLPAQRRGACVVVCFACALLCLCASVCVRPFFVCSCVCLFVCASSCLRSGPRGSPRQSPRRQRVVAAFPTGSACGSCRRRAALRARAPWAGCSRRCAACSCTWLRTSTPDPVRNPACLGISFCLAASVAVALRLWVRVRVRLCLCVRLGLCACAFVRAAVHPRMRRRSPLAPCSVRTSGVPPGRYPAASPAHGLGWFVCLIVCLFALLFRLVAGIGEYSHKKKAAFWRELLALFPHLIDFLCSCVAGRVCSPCFSLSQGRFPSRDRLRRGRPGFWFPSRRPARALVARVRSVPHSARELGQPQLVDGLDRFYREFISSPDDRPDIEVRPACTHRVLTGYSRGTYRVRTGCSQGTDIACRRSTARACRSQAVAKTATRRTQERTRTHARTHVRTHEKRKTKGSAGRARQGQHGAVLVGARGVPGAGVSTGEGWAHPCPHLRRDWAHPSAPRTGAHPFHICTGRHTHAPTHTRRHRHIHARARTHTHTQPRTHTPTHPPTRTHTHTHACRWHVSSRAPPTRRNATSS